MCRFNWNTHEEVALKKYPMTSGSHTVSRDPGGHGELTGGKLWLSLTPGGQAGGESVDNQHSFVASAPWPLVAEAGPWWNSQVISSYSWSEFPISQ
jgi:hypothetical protein